jgi:hypothetical protein
MIFHHFPTSIAVVGFQRRLEVGRPGQICTCRLAKTELVGFQEGDGIMVKDVFFGMVYASGSSVAPEHPQNKFVKGQDIQEPRADQCRCLKANNHHGFLYNFLLNQTAVGHGGSPYLKKPLKKRMQHVAKPHP